MYFKISEAEVRTHLTELEKLGFIKINIGRVGNEVTEKGIEYLLKEGFLLDENDNEMTSKIEEMVGNIL